MTLMAAPSARDLAESSTRVAIDYLISIIEGQPRTEFEHQIALMSRVYYQTTQIAADATDPLGAEYRELFNKALGDQDAEDFLIAFNSTCARFEQASKGPSKPTKFEYEAAEQAVLIASLKRLEEATARGFYFPVFRPAEARDHRQCTGL